MVELPTFKDPAWLQLALTHRSYLNEHPQRSADNQRLEFLGDAILGFLVGQLLYHRYPHLDEGKLTPLRSRLVDEQQLAKLAREMGLGDRLLLGKGAIRDGGRHSPSVLSDALEALLGAYYLDSGIEAVQGFVETVFTPLADSWMKLQADPQILVDPKSGLQQWALKQGQGNPEYVTIAESGPDHAKEFTVEVRINGQVYGQGSGRSKKAAEKQAAEDALAQVSS